MDLIIVFLACPQDMLRTNGVDCTPTDAHFPDRKLRACERFGRAKLGPRSFDFAQDEASSPRRSLLDQHLTSS